jgi:hypothetical protein
VREKARDGEEQAHPKDVGREVRNQQHGGRVDVIGDPAGVGHERNRGVNEHAEQQRARPKRIQCMNAVTHFRHLQPFLGDSILPRACNGVPMESR